MSVAKIVRNGLAGALIALVPISAASAAARPSAPNPTAGATAVITQDSDGGQATVPRPAWAIIAATLAVGIWIAVDKDGNGHGNLSRG